MRPILLATLALGLLTATTYAREINFDKDQKAPKKTGIFLVGDEVKAKASALKFEAHVGKVDVFDVKSEAGDFTQISIPGFQHSGEIGAPAIPVMNRLIEVPLGAKVEVKIEAAPTKTYTLKELGIKSPLYPRQPPQPKSGPAVPFAYEKRAYQAKGFAADEPVSFEDLGLLRDRRLIMLKIAPIAYDAAAGALEVRNDVKVTMSLSGADLKATQAHKAIYASPNFEFVSSSVLTPASVKELAPAKSCRPACYLIVSDRKFEKDLEPFVAWKTAKGYRVVVSFTDEIGGATPDKIKAHIHGLYNNATAEQGAPDYVLFVGDHNNLPANPGKSGSHITDLYYVAVTAGDNLPDILTGRFSATTSEELAPQIEKTVEYEKYAFPDPSFLERTAMIAGWDYSHTKEWGWPQINYGTKYYFNAEHGMPGTKAFLVSRSDEFESEIHELCSSGAAFVNYTAHGSETSWGDPSYTKADIDNMKNKGKYALFVGNCCLTNSFQVSACFGEMLLRAKDKGAIGYLGASNSTYWDEDLWWGNGFYPVLHPNPQGNPPKPEDTQHGAYDGVFQAGACSQAALNMAGNLAVQTSATSRKLYYWETYHLMGDPSLCVYFGIPKDSGTSHPAEISKTATILEVKTSPKACVGVTQDGKLLGAGCADGAGLAMITIKTEGTNPLNVVATGQNLKPYFGTVTVTE